MSTTARRRARSDAPYLEFLLCRLAFDQTNRMDLPVRKKLPHTIPQWVAEDSWFFITIKCVPQGKNQLCRADIGDGVLAAMVVGQRLADQTLTILELLVEASYTRNKQELLAQANRRIEVLRWLVRMAKDRRILTNAQYEHSAERLTECGKMVGGLLKQQAQK